MVKNNQIPFVFEQRPLRIGVTPRLGSRGQGSRVGQGQVVWFDTLESGDKIPPAVRLGMIAADSMCGGESQKAIFPLSFSPPYQISTYIINT